MNNRPTPETDDVAQPSSLLQYETVNANFARKLERERDEAREELKHIGEYGTEEINAAIDLRQKLASALVERDEALMDRANGDIATMTTNHYERLLRERDEARERIERQKLEINRLNGATNHAGGTPLKIALRERDEARDKYDALATEHMLAVNKLCEERDEAREQVNRYRYNLDLLPIKWDI